MVGRAVSLLLCVLLYSTRIQFSFPQSIFPFNVSVNEYWIRPDSTSECGFITSQSYCFTLTELIVNSNITHNEVHILNIHFLPGNHISRVEGLLIIGNAYSEATRVLSTTVDTVAIGDQDTAIIDCKLGQAVSFVFLGHLFLTIRDITMQSCGLKLPAENNFMGSHSLNRAIASIAAANILSELILTNVEIFNSRGAGLVIVLKDGSPTNTETVYINNTVIHHSKYHRDSFSKIQGNLYIKISSHFRGTNKYSITLANTTLSKGKSKGCYTNQCASGGLTLALMVNLYSHSVIDIAIKDCIFIENEAWIGGGINLFTPDIFLKIANISVIRSVFRRNSAYLNGGGMSVVAHDAVNLYTFETVFIGNTARDGGAIYYSASFRIGVGSNMYANCIFRSNSARHGTAIYLIYDDNKIEPPTSIIQGSLFTQNRCTATDILDHQTEFESGVIYCRNLEQVCIQDNVTIIDNQDRAIYVNQTGLLISGNVYLEKNYAKKSDGGAILFDCSLDNSISYIHFTEQSDTQLYILKNQADGYSGGIAVRHSCGQSDCFFGDKLTNKPKVIMAGNLGLRGGNSIYGGNFEQGLCNLWEIVDISERYTLSAVSSPPYRVCICSLTNFSQTHECLSNKHIDTYPGQMFQIPLVCVGQYNHSSFCVIQAILDSTHMHETSIDDETDIKNIALECKKLSYSILTHQADFTVMLYLKIIANEQNSLYEPRPKKIPVAIEVMVKACPPGFNQDYSTRKCICTDYLNSKGITCDINNRKIYKSSSMWIGNYSGAVVVHENCPFDYCKNNFEGVDPYNQQEQCDFNHSGILCSACQPGLSLVLGTSQCKQCPNIYLLLLIPFTLAGVLLIILLLKCNLTVSTGTINGLIFYANVIHATQTAYFPTSTSNTFVHVLSIFIAWLNLDLGIQTCFIDGLNTYYRTWLQFAFPLYVWTIVGSLILISRYSITVSRWTGSNTVSVLATLFLLSYTKLLRTTFNIFSSTVLTDINGTSTSVWLLDGHYTFLQWPHSLLFTAGLATLLAHILPFTLLLLTAPILQRYSHHRPLRWVNKVMPLLDAYQGPYRVKFRYWTGLLIFARLTILTTVSLNITGDQKVNLFMVTIVLTLIVISLMIFGITNLYRDKFNNYLELFFLSNLVILTVASQFFHSNGKEKNDRLSIVISFLVGGAFIMTIVITSYHCIISCLKIEAIRKMKGRITSKFERPLDQTQTDDSIATNNSQHSAPTVTIVELQEPLLDEDPSQ